MKYAIKVTDFYDSRGEGTEAYSYYHITDNNEEEDNKIMLFDSESEAKDYINNNKVISHHSYAEVVVYSEMILNKNELIDFIGRVNDQLILQDIVKDFCKSVNLDIEINYKFAVYIKTYDNGLLIEAGLFTNYLKDIVLFDSWDEAHRACKILGYNHTCADVVVYKRIIKHGNTTITYDLY